MSTAKRILQEPLLHFVVAGALVFLIYSLVRERPPEETAKRIVVGPGRIQQLASTFEQEQGRPPTGSELGDLVDDFVLEEIFLREAAGMRVVEEDPALRRQLREKVEVLRTGVKPLIQPTDVKLAEYLAKHADEFSEPRYSFRQIFFEPDKHEPDPEGFVAEQLALARRMEAVQGDPNEVLQKEYVRIGRQSLEDEFGSDFATALHAAELGLWSGPLRSKHGLHLVKLEVRLPERVPKLDEVREAVLAKWNEERQRETKDALRDQLRRKYEIVVEWPGREEKR